MIYFLNSLFPFLIFKKNLNLLIMSIVVKRDGTYYRRKHAMQEGRPEGRKGHPPLLEDSALPILFSRIRQAVLKKIQVTKDYLVQMVYFFSNF
jgi:hypothetical protein